MTGPVIEERPGPLRELASFFRAALVHPAEPGASASASRPNAPFPEHHGGQRRRLVVVALTLAAGAVAMHAALAVRPGDPSFYLATIGVAAIWAVGAFGSGPIHLGHGVRRDAGRSRAVLQGVLLGALLLAIFLAGAVVVGQVPTLRRPVDRLLDHARYGSLLGVGVITAVNGVAEELFFRGAVFAALPGRWKVLGSTLIYAAATSLSGVPLLTFAALCLGLLTGCQRRVTGGVAGPISSHLTWSLGMLCLLPLVLR